MMSLQEKHNKKDCFRYNFSKDIQSIEEISEIAQAIILEEKPKMIIEPFACGKTVLSNYLIMDSLPYAPTIHLTDINYGDRKTSYQNSYKKVVKAKCDYRSLTPWLLDKDFLCYLDIPKESETFSLDEFWGLAKIIEYQNFTIIKSERLPPHRYYSFGNNFYTSIKGRLFNWLIKKENTYNAY